MYCRFTFVENTIRISPKVATAKFLGSDRLFCFIVSIIKFGSFKKAFTVITSLSEFHFRFERFTLLVKKKVISMSYSSSTSSWKPWIWMRLVLIFKAKDIYTNTTNHFTAENLSNDQEDRPNQQENSHKRCDEKEHHLLRLKKSQWELRQEHDQKFSLEEKPL